MADLEHPSGDAKPPAFSELIVDEIHARRMRQLNRRCRIRSILIGFRYIQISFRITPVNVATAHIAEGGGL